MLAIFTKHVHYHKEKNTRSPRVHLAMEWVALCSGVSRISFRGGFKIFLEKSGYLHGAKRHMQRVAKPGVC